MNGDVEELLREGLDRLTAQAEVPPGLAGRVRAHRRRRQIAARAALVTATAAVTAAAVIAATLPGAGQRSDAINARTTAYVITRVENALATENFVIQGQATGTLTVTVHGHRVSSSNGQTSSWSYGKRDRMEEFWRGKPYLADGTALVDGKLVGAYVTYYNHKYSLSPLGHYHLKACSTTAQLVLGGPSVTMPDWPAFIRAMLRCQAATVTGHARIGGVPTTVISGLIDIPLSRGYTRTVGEARVRVRYTLYVDSANYLPVRALGSTETYGGKSGPTVSQYATNVTWLPPTQANVDKALVTIPDGYTQVSSPASQ